MLYGEMATLGRLKLKKGKIKTDLNLILDLSTEPWLGNYVVQDSVLKLKKQNKTRD